MMLIQLLLPTMVEGRGVETALFASTRNELVERFGGITAYLQAPAQGVWTSPEGAREHDRMVMVEILAETFDRFWWRVYAKALAQRFGQETIHVRAISVQTLDHVEE